MGRWVDGRSSYVNDPLECLAVILLVVNVCRRAHVSELGACLKVEPCDNGGET